MGGLVTRDQMVGPWQVPVADAAVTLSGFSSETGEAMAMGERTPLAVLNAPASGRMAIAEAVTNIASAAIADISQIRLSANWMAAAGEPGQEGALFDTVQDGRNGSVPRTGDRHTGGQRLAVDENGLAGRNRGTAHAGAGFPDRFGFAPVTDVHRSLTPQLDMECGESKLLLVDLGNGRNRLGGSALAQVNGPFRPGSTRPGSPGATEEFFQCHPGFE